jgi:mono/diheme cytochrome c family protein
LSQVSAARERDGSLRPAVVAFTHFSSRFAFALALALGWAAELRAAPQPPAFESQSGQELYQAACAACHGRDGAGMPAAVVGFETPLPDFNDCSFATPEADADWMAVVHDGGPARAFDRRMPAFGEALSGAALQRILDYVRGFCPDQAWPRGELNLPRALVTEKAFPENEAVATIAFADGATGSELLYERRIAARSQFEIAVPFEIAHGDGATRGGVGDLAMALKHALFHRLSAGTILSAGAELVLPTGSEERGFGKGTTIVEPFLAWGQILPANSFLQLHTGLELSTDTSRASHETFLRTALGTTVTARPFGRSWSPIVELLGTRELETGERYQWDVVPQMQVSLSRRQHILVNGGIRIPVSQREGRGVQVITYLLWDWFDGGFTDGWR